MSEITKSAVSELSRPLRKTLMPWIGFVILLLALPNIFSSNVGLYTMNLMGIFIIFALSYNMLLGQGGMLSFGHAVYFGLGGFMSVHFMNYIEDGLFVFPMYLVPIFGGIIGLVFAIIIGSFSTRRAGTVFAMISLGVGELMAASSLIFVAFFGGEEGVSGDRTTGPELAGIDFGKDIHIYYLIAAWVFVTVALMYLFSRTPAGRMANAVRDNAERAEFIGYSQRKVRFVSFCASGFFAGIAGGLFALNFEIVTEENLNALTSGVVLLMAYIGGVGFFIGPIVGAVVFTLLQSILSNYTDIWQLYVGILFVLTVMYVPQGLTGIIMMHTAAWRMKRLGILILPYLRIGIPALAMLAGIAAFLETVHHMRTAVEGETLMSLMGIEYDSHGIVTWIVILVLTFVGGYLTRTQLPQLREAWETANKPPASTKGAAS
ncbi:branched-chain amino acid ABC transporter permease [Sneathiella chungangensis]|uniref:Branched-chain amino acid ABC transporter permease n=1 Tax=Sneathiella chungangensis TaxID=1418234 RepID=A0A845MI33_9PROT|nr:branched-chain amino acid ABC transporter permease [Sneathiella chungangensis]MZR22947.1 branched-chain amino acid ABC transporter permease [Sneathiella chungangensis]